MRWVTCVSPLSTEPQIGVVVDNAVHVYEDGPGYVPLVSLLGDDGEALERAGQKALANPAEVLPLASVTLLPPIPKPGTIRDFYAFEQHVKVARQRRGLDMDPLWYSLPVFYFSNPYASIGHGSAVWPPHTSTELDYELEVAAVIGKGGRNIPEQSARSHIVGFMIMNDWSARDLQREEMRLSMGPVKGKDFATTLGPCLVTPDELESARAGTAFNLAMTAKVNGEVYSQGNLQDLHWSFEEMVAYASRDTRCEPGDIIGSGTCGTGCILELSLVSGTERFPWLRAGDTVELSVERLGALENHIVDRPGR